MVDPFASAVTRDDVGAVISGYVRECVPGDLVVDWVVVAALVAPDGTHSVFAETSRGDAMPAYVARGLLEEAIDIQRGEYRRVD